ncbi:MAG: hypothetical protein PUB22_01065 [Clostridiales bacterium]|nr:hypothetical protein [Clostridiales bacterium]
MRKRMSFVYLAAAQIWKRVLILLAAVGGIQIFLFCWKMNSYGIPLQEELWEGMDWQSISIAAAAALILLCVILERPLGEQDGSRIRYTLQRLSLTNREQYFLQTVVHWTVILLFFSVQLLTAYGLCMWYMKMADDAVISSQTVFVAFYQNPYLHNLLPLENYLRGIRNILAIAALGMNITESGWNRRCETSKKGSNLLVILMAMALAFQMMTDIFDILIIICSVVSLIRSIGILYSDMSMENGANHSMQEGLEKEEAL